MAKGRFYERQSALIPIKPTNLIVNQLECRCTTVESSICLILQ